MSSLKKKNVYINLKNHVNCLTILKSQDEKYLPKNQRNSHSIKGQFLKNKLRQVNARFLTMFVDSYEERLVGVGVPPGGGDLDVVDVG